MRMQDGPTVEVEISVEATPARVWELVGDLALMGEWSPEYQGGDWLDGATGPPSECGSRAATGAVSGSG